MPLQTGSTLDGSVIETIVSEFVRGVVAAVPKALSGLVFLTLAYVAIRIIRSLLRAVLARVYGDQELVVELAVTVAHLFLWFGAGLGLLKILGMGDLAASLGTATGFIALGVAFALNEMIADTVAGVYLLRDPDFNEGDLVTTASVNGTVSRIDLRKTRIRDETGDLVVVANRDVEERWTQEVVENEPETGAESGTESENESSGNE
jgi:small-conductance mechanosensitive channel